MNPPESLLRQRRQCRIGAGWRSANPDHADLSTGWGVELQRASDVGGFRKQDYPETMDSPRNRMRCRARARLTGGR